MPVASILFGILLIVVGAAGYLYQLVTAEAGAPVSITALIPAFFGIALLLLGLAARKENWRKHAMHAAAVVALVGVIGALFRPVRTLLAGGEVKNYVALTSQMFMAALCAIFLALCVNSFVQARRRQAAARRMDQPTGV